MQAAKRNLSPVPIERVAALPPALCRNPSVAGTLTPTTADRIAAMQMGERTRVPGLDCDFTPTPAADRIAALMLHFAPPATPPPATPVHSTSRMTSPTADRDRISALLGGVATAVHSAERTPAATPTAADKMPVLHENRFSIPLSVLPASRSGTPQAAMEKMPALGAMADRRGTTPPPSQASAEKAVPAPPTSTNVQLPSISGASAGAGHGHDLTMATPVLNLSLREGGEMIRQSQSAGEGLPPEADTPSFGHQLDRELLTLKRGWRRDDPEAHCAPEPLVTLDRNFDRSLSPVCSESQSLEDGPDSGGGAARYRLESFGGDAVVSPAVPSKVHLARVVKSRSVPSLPSPTSGSVQRPGSLPEIPRTPGQPKSKPAPKAMSWA